MFFFYRWTSALRSKHFQVRVILKIESCFFFKIAVDYLRFTFILRYFMNDTAFLPGEYIILQTFYEMGIFKNSHCIAFQMITRCYEFNWGLPYVISVHIYTVSSFLFPKYNYHYNLCMWWNIWGSCFCNSTLHSLLFFQFLNFLVDRCSMKSHISHRGTLELVSCIVSASDGNPSYVRRFSRLGRCLRLFVTPWLFVEDIRTGVELIGCVCLFVE